MKKIISFFLITIFVCEFFFAKQKNKIIPNWINSPYSIYSSEQYYAASSSDKDLEKAEIQAIESIAGIFRRDIKSSTSAESYKTHYSNSLESETESFSEIGQEIFVNIEQNNLIGIEITEKYYDDINNIWYVLALLDKDKTADVYIELIKNNESSIKQLLTRESELSLGMEKISCFYRAMSISQLNEEYISRLKFLNPQKTDLLKGNLIPHEMIKTKYDELVSKNPIKIEINNDYNSMVKMSLEEVLKSFGLTITEKETKYKLFIEITTVNRLVENPEMNYCEFTLTSNMKAENEIELFPWSFVGRAGGRNDDLATRKAYSIIRDKILKDYSRILDDYLYGE